MSAYTLQVNKPSAYSLQSRSSQRQILCILYSVGNKSGFPFRHPTGRLWEKGMGHTAQAIMLSLSVPNVSYTAHLLSELWEIQGVFWWCPDSHSMFATALQRQIRRTARREVSHYYMKTCFASMPTGCRNARVLYIFCRKSTYSDFHFICITVQILPTLQHTSYARNP